jgi:carbon-monoxide dehydrogenase large subunit
VFSNTVSTGAYRRAGGPKVMFVMERLIERAARELGFDRGRHLVRMSLPDVRKLPPLRNRDSLVFATAGFEFG